MVGVMMAELDQGQLPDLKVVPAVVVPWPSADKASNLVQVMEEMVLHIM
tara:strand:- start:100 stop:246 length:147 start_codon:yes stop_codon:yes gene_type:complete